MTCEHTHKDMPNNAECDDCHHDRCKKHDLHELKTLRDLHFGDEYVDRVLSNEITHDEAEILFLSVLRKEAVKWIKSMGSQRMKRRGFDNCPSWYDYGCSDVNDFIKEFFNITEGDLFQEAKARCQELLG